LVQLKNVTKRYGDKLALNGVSLSIGEGEIVGLLGRNGAGKSTMMNILTGYLPCSGGSVFVAGADMAKEPQKAKRHIGYLPEQPPLYDSMTVGEYLRFVGKIKRIPPKELFAKVDDMCRRVGLEDVSDRMIRNLSKGYRQRTGIAQAMLGEPELLVLDEPTIGLDPKQIVDIRELIRDFGKNRTVLISSHILTEIAEICERVIIIRDGALVGDRKVSQLRLEQRGESRLQIQLSGNKEQSSPVLSSLKGIKSFKYLGSPEPDSCDWELIVGDESRNLRGELFDALAAAGLKLLMSKFAQASIEEVFLSLTEEKNENEMGTGGDQ